tara:strand:- start:158 stop:1348 length:1191 start_codon:yes stop_codon:yes gene_type:complete
MIPRFRIGVAGGGVVGSLVAAGLADRHDVEVICCERSPQGAQIDAGTGLNIGPNAVKALQLFLPEVASHLSAGALPWADWTVALTDGTPLARFDIGQLADNPGLRIGWAELNARLRDSAGSAIRYGTDVIAAGRTGERPFMQVRDDSGTHGIDALDLLIAADGRYSLVRDSLLAPDPTQHPGIALFRLLCPAPAECPIDDYAQWFNGPNRLLAFRIPGDLVYCAGSFPLQGDTSIPEPMKHPDAIRALFVPASGAVAECVRFLLDAIGDDEAQLHWARLQERETRLVGAHRVVLAGDAAHPMLPTLGQGATQSIEDACVLVDEIRRALADTTELSVVPERFAARRQKRIEFVTDFSRDATDTMLAGADPIAGTARKLEPAFLANLQQLYRDAPRPR